MRIDRTQAEALAAFVIRVRTDWSHGGVKVKWTRLQRRKRPPEAATPEGQPRRLIRSRTA